MLEVHIECGILEAWDIIQRQMVVSNLTPIPFDWNLFVDSQCSVRHLYNVHANIL